MKISFFILPVFFPSLLLAQNISGNIKDFNFNAPLEDVSVTLKDNQTNEILGIDSTDENGNYNIDYVVSVNQSKSLPNEFYLSNPYPNPFNPQTRIDFFSPTFNNYRLRIYSIIGELVYAEDFNIDAGYHSFAITGLGAAGVYLFNITSANFTATKKLLLLDGGSGNTKVELKSNSRILNKIGTNELRLELRKNDYEDKDSIFTWQMNLIVNAELIQIPIPDTIHFFTDQNMTPTNTPGNNTAIAATSNLFNGTTGANGEFVTDFIVQYTQNPSDPSDRKYVPATFTVTATRSNTLGGSQEFTVSDVDTIFWFNDLQQTLINKDGSVTGNVDNEQSQNLPGVLVNYY